MPVCVPDQKNHPWSVKPYMDRIYWQIKNKEVDTMGLYIKIIQQAVLFFPVVALLFTLPYMFYNYQIGRAHV